MQLRDTPEEATFRAEVRAWLDEHNPGLEGLPDTEAKKAWSRKIYDAGYAGLTWPKEYGGGGALVRGPGDPARGDGRAPRRRPHLGRDRARHGRADDHRARHRGAEAALPREDPLRPRRSGARASPSRAPAPTCPRARTSAELRDGHFVVNGQKVWSSYAHIADWCILVTRSDPDSQRHAGPHVHGRRHALAGRRGAAAPPDHGRRGVQRDLLHRRRGAGRERPRRDRQRLGGRDDDAPARARHARLRAHRRRSRSPSRKLLALAKERGVDDSRLRDRVAREWIELQALKLTNYRALTKLVKTGIPGPEGSVSKLHWSEQNQRLTKLALEILEDGVDGDGWLALPAAPLRGNTIEAGTSEILRNIIAERVLGLPRSR